MNMNTPNAKDNEDYTIGDLAKMIAAIKDDIANMATKDDIANLKNEIQDQMNQTFDQMRHTLNRSYQTQRRINSLGTVELAPFDNPVQSTARFMHQQKHKKSSTYY